MSNTDTFNEEVFEPIESTEEITEPVVEEEIVEEVGNTEVESTEEITEPTQIAEPTEEEKSVAHFQKIAQKKDDDLKAEIEQRSQLEARLAELENSLKPKEEPLTPPIPPTDPDDIDAKIEYSIKFAEYNNKLFQKNNEFIQAEQNARTMETQMLEDKRQWLGGFAEKGATPEEAEYAYNFLSSDASKNIDKLLEFSRSQMNGGVKPKVVTKPKLNTPPPLVTGQTNNELSPDDAFNESLNIGGSKSLL